MEFRDVRTRPGIRQVETLSGDPFIEKPRPSVVAGRFALHTLGRWLRAGCGEQGAQHSKIDILVAKRESKLTSHSLRPDSGGENAP